MANPGTIEKLLFEALKIDGTNYNDWAIDAEVTLTSKDICEAIYEDVGINAHMKAKALVVLRHHMADSLKRQYKNQWNPRLLWDALKTRFAHTKTINLPAARHDWVNLRVQDFKSVDEYNSELFRISAELEMCGFPLTDAEQIEKTLSTHHPTNLVISNQYRNTHFTQYSQLIAYMLQAEKYSILLMNNAKSRPPGTLPLPPAASETNYTNLPSTSNERNMSAFRGRGRGRGQSGMRGRGGRYTQFSSRGRGRGSYNQRRPWRTPELLRRSQRGGSSSNSYNSKKESPITCFRCGAKGHIKKDCHAASHLVLLYKNSINKQEIEAHGAYLESDEIMPEIHLVTSPIDLDDPSSCIVDSGTSHTVLRDKRHFLHIIPSNRPITTITGHNSLEQGHGPAKIMLPNGTRIKIDDAIFAPSATRNLLSFKDIRQNALHICTENSGTQEVLNLVRKTATGNETLETLLAYPMGFYVATAQCYTSIIQQTTPIDLWHRRLGHPGNSMLYRIMQYSRGIPASVRPGKATIQCEACSKGKLITRPAPVKTDIHIPDFLERLHVDVCGPIDPPSGPFKYFLAVIDSSSKWSRISLLSTRNLVFPRLLAHILRLRTQFPEYAIKTIRVDGAGEFISKTFNEFCTVAGIELQYPVPYVHFQNGIAESLMKRIQLIARPLIMQTSLPASAWGHAVLHAAALLLYRPSAYNVTAPYHLAFGDIPNLAHLRVFGCEVQVPLLGPKRTKLGQQRRPGIYVGYESPSIIRYLDPVTADVFKARFQDTHFYEDKFPQYNATWSIRASPPLGWIVLLLLKMNANEVIGQLDKPTSANTMPHIEKLA